jgi:hypothetical protein
MAARASSPLKDSDGFIKRIPLQGKMTSDRHLVAPVRKPLRNRIKSRRTSKRPTGPAPAAIFPGSQVQGQTVAFFPGCMIDRLLPEMGESAITVFETCGCHVIFPPDQHCCGLVALNSGDTKRGRTMAEQTIRMLEKVDADWIVSNSTSCCAAIVDDYQHLFRHDPAWLQPTTSGASARANRRCHHISGRRGKGPATAEIESARASGDVSRCLPVAQCVGDQRAAPISHTRRAGAGTTRDLRLQCVLRVRWFLCDGFSGSLECNPAEEVGFRRADRSAGVGFGQPGLHARGSKVRAMHLMELPAERIDADE